MGYLLDGKMVREKRAKVLKERMALFTIPPKLVIMQIGAVAESSSYIQQKKIFGEKIGALVEHIVFPESVSEKELEKAIVSYNKDKAVHGVILQLPVPKTISWQAVVNTILPEKDVDGLTEHNFSLLANNISGGHVPATARGVLSLLTEYELPLSGKKIVVVGRSALVGKPIMLCALNAGATVTMCHSGTINLAQETKQADILIVAVGKAHLIDEHYIRPGQVVIDVGINALKKNKLQEELPKIKLVGDVDTEKVLPIVQAVSPVPGGVGPLTVLSLFENLADAYERQQNIV